MDAEIHSPQRRRGRRGGAENYKSEHYRTISHAGLSTRFWFIVFVLRFKTQRRHNSMEEENLDLSWEIRVTEGRAVTDLRSAQSRRRSSFWTEVLCPKTRKCSRNLHHI